MTIQASQVKALREQTGAGMMECKSALVEAEGDMEEAKQIMRKKGQAKAGKKAGRTAAEGAIFARVTEDKAAGVLVEVNSETDFVARDQAFVEFGQSIAQLALDNQVSSAEQLMELTTSQGETVEQSRKDLVAKLGENIQLRRVRFCQAEGGLSYYLHGERIGVLVDTVPANDQVGKDVAMHIAAFNAQAIKPEDVPQEVVEKEKAFFREQAQESGKPEHIIEKMISGRIDKFVNESSLYGQAFAKNPEQTVAEYLKEQSCDVHNFYRLEVGEGIEVDKTDFASEVQAQLEG